MPRPTDPLVLEQLVAAPRERVFDAWTDSAQLAGWFCPDPRGEVEAEVEAHTGGRLWVRMRMGPDIHTVSGEFREVVRPARLVFTWDWEEPASRMGETLVVVDFSEAAGGTVVRVTHLGLPTPEARTTHDAGWSACLLRLARERVPA